MQSVICATDVYSREITKIVWSVKSLCLSKTLTGVYLRDITNTFFFFFLVALECGWGCSSLVEHRTVMPLTQVPVSGTANPFSPRVNHQCRLSYVCAYAPRAIACINICAHVKDPVDHVSSVDNGSTKIPSMHRKLGSATLSQLAFPGESNPIFQWEKSHWKLLTWTAT